MGRSKICIPCYIGPECWKNMGRSDMRNSPTHPFPPECCISPTSSPKQPPKPRTSYIPRIREQECQKITAKMISLPSCEGFDLPPLKTIVSTAATAAATAVLIRSATADLVPGDLSECFTSRLRSFSKKFSSEFIVVIDEFNGIAPNQLFEAATVYIGSQITPSIRRVKANKSDQEKDLSFAIDEKEEFLDRYEGVKLKWTLLNTRINNSPRESNRSSNKLNTAWKSELKFYELRFNQKHKEMVFKRYLPHILQSAKSIKQEKKEIKLHTVDYNGTDYWSSVNLDHPATFDKIAMDPERKKSLIEDLDRFRSRKDYYKRVGKAWKRGYLLYGPPARGNQA